MGMPTFSRQLLTSVSMGLMNSNAAFYGGDVALAATGIVTRTMMISMYVIFGLSQGFQPVAGYNFGAKAFDRLKASLFFTISLSVSIASVSALVFLVFGEEILSIFRPSVAVMTVSMDFMLYFIVSLLLMSFTNVLGVYYQAIGKGKPALILSIARQGVFFIPLIMLLPSIYGLQGVFLTQPLADLLTLILSLLFFIPTRKELNNEIQLMV